MVEGSSIEMFGFLVLFNESKAVTFADICNRFAAVEGDSLIEVGHGWFVLLQFEVEFASVNVGFIVFRVVFDAFIELSQQKCTISSV